MFLLYFFVVKFNILYPSYYLFLFFIIVGFTYFVLQFRVNSINPISSRLTLSVKQLQPMMEELKKARALRKRILTNSYKRTDCIIKESSLTAITDHREHLMKIFQLFEDAAEEYADVLTSDTDIETADEYYEDEQKLYVEQLIKLNSAMDTLSVNQELARKDVSTVVAMPEVLNTPVLEFQPLNVNHPAVHPECLTLACKLELTNLPQNEHSEDVYEHQHVLSEIQSNPPVSHTCSDVCSKPRKSSYDHQQTINAPLLHAIELCIDSLRASQIVKPPHDIHTGDSDCETLLKQVQLYSISTQSLSTVAIMCLNYISNPPNINAMNNAGMLGYQNLPGG